MLDPFFPFRGLVIGDCCTFRVPLGFCCCGFLEDLACMVELGGAEWESRFMSTGEFVVFECNCSYAEACSFCA